MGLFDKLLSRGAQVLGDAVSDAVSGKVSEVMNGDNEIGNAMRSMKESVSMKDNTGEEIDNRSFDEKLRQILENAGITSVRTNVSVDDVSAERGCQLYTLQPGCHKPSAISYVIYRDEQPVMFIRAWMDYSEYNRLCNRQIIDNCKVAGIQLQDYFLYLPNEYSYMEERVGNGLYNM